MKLKPNKKLIYFFHRKKGRNNSGQITIRHRGGGHKRRYRRLNFKNFKPTISGIVKNIEYDPNRTSKIMLIHYLDGSKTYAISPKNIHIGHVINSNFNAPIRIGNSLQLKNIPLGTSIYNIEFIPGGGGKIARSAGTSAFVIAKDRKFVTLRLPSGEIRLFLESCWANIGEVSNSKNINRNNKKAGYSRWIGRRPKVRGVVMNPIDHPHGGGEGKAPIGKSHPVTPWGKPTLGKKTRLLTKYSQSLILKRRY
uniref:Large ribosomal subunit protein uL2m n=1 Tax=Avrainvillea sp. HV04061 TaxID=2364086 RepID=A0A3B8CM31_9CHLO|nr:ribosomal protein L2 [Avrainvillea sp. HV04061]